MKNNENWFLYVDAREDDNLTHDEALKLLINKGVSKEEIENISKEYYKLVKDYLFE